MEQFIGNRWVQSTTRFRKKMDTPTLTLSSLNKSGSEAMKLDFSVEKIPRTFYCMFVQFKDRLEGT